MRKVALYFLVSAIIQVCCSLFIGTIWSLMTDSFDMSGEKLITISAISSIITIIVFVAAKWTPVKRILQGKKLRESAYWSAILAVSIIIPSMLLEALIPEAWKKDILEDVFKMILQSPWGYLQIGILAPIAEEIVFRGAIQRTAANYFEEKGVKNFKWKAILLSAVLFAIIHGNPAQIPHALLMGVLLGWMYSRSGSIIPCVIVHWINNSIGFAQYFLFPESYDMTAIELFASEPVWRIMAWTLLSLYFFYRAIASLNKVWKKEETNNLP